uniref:Setae polypeptide n=1 Tax=Ochrogaster lunifer TaxID=319761 RepID=A0AA49ESM0_OCHLU|nr:setae polypeptide [Ochrogaster lunifer]
MNRVLKTILVFGLLVQVFNCVHGRDSVNEEQETVSSDSDPGGSDVDRTARNIITVPDRPCPAGQRRDANKKCRVVY